MFLFFYLQSLRLRWATWISNQQLWKLKTRKHIYVDKMTVQSIEQANKTHKQTIYMYNETQKIENSQQWNQMYYSQVLHAHHNFTHSHTHTFHIYATEVFDQAKWMDRANSLPSSSDTLEWTTRSLCVQILLSQILFITFILMSVVRIKINSS